MKIYNLMPIFTSRNIKGLIAKAHAALGSTIGEVAMPLTVPAIREFNRPFTGALSGLNAPQFTASRGDCVFWLKLDKVSRRNWTRIPFEPGHGFWLKLDKDSSANWTHQIARG